MKLTLDLQFFSGEKTERATPKKRRETRKKGQVAKSADVNTAVTLFIVFLSLLFFGSFMRDRLIGLIERYYKELIMLKVTEANIPGLFGDLALEAGMILAPVMVAALISGVLSNYLQVGFLFAPEVVKPDLKKLDPLKGFKRIYSIRAFVELLKSILKIVVVGTVTFAVLWQNFGDILRIPLLAPGKALSYVGWLAFLMGVSAAVALIFLAALDYLYQKFDYEKSIRMSKQDIKDEYKKTEGDPLIKSKIKQKQKEMAMRRMMQEVPKADVIITNPTHYAVALKYDENKMDAPFIVAKGVDLMALKIRQIAKEHDVMTVENRPLARALYDQVEIDQAVPEEFFKAIAEILAFVYKAKQKI
ncbi:flagellar biosynthesis protein FlhB [Bacillus sonorensis]|uniref:Flagellar biosynthetic protein FlhB n=2 Tax=Bacillus sonorensis TaxID=119858 RepID=M5P4A0_9BACI|nr:MULTISPECIES: flagellar biosynthesis protein FlhB [Bacillus]TWK71991.1 Flagellar biosynthetic protein FlhB [Bacillus paralicheniformis]EME74278.1 flagellar biosynthesis protein FlhB [Bacillus sonorensis L12]MBG9917129.1 flagellar biosynthesis protein FlhB [Bacillus sonorensis]MCZ0073715.1 flagellar biosynthesis protein FlhB [Bacillus sonorensis]MCZ0092337.1 flagellar biosynthesis protein FlhB [Bacillus sonorensis]